MAIYRKLLVCKEIVYTNKYGNCVSNDTGILTVSSERPQQSIATDTFEQGKVFEIEFDYDTAVEESMEKFDQHLCAYIASTIETKIIEMIKKQHKKECSDCIAVFTENEKADDDFITRKKSKDCQNPCISTVHIIKATNKILDLLVDQFIYEDAYMYGSTLKTIMDHLHTEKLYTQSLFELHATPPKKSVLMTHKEGFIFQIVNEYMKLKSRNIGSRISEEERGNYIRHNYKKRIHESGQ